MGGGIGEDVVRDAAGTGPVDVADGDATEDECRAVSWCEPRRPVEERPDHLTPDSARAEHADPQGRMGHRHRGPGETA